MKIDKLYKLSVCLSVLSMAMAGAVNAQSNNFADDFSSDTTRYSGGSFNDSTQDFSIDYLPGELRLSATATQQQPGSAYLRINDNSDSIEVDAAIDSATSESGGSMFLDAQFYNDTGSGPSEFGEGDVTIQLHAGIAGDGSSYASYCMSRQTGNGDRADVGEPGSEFCNGFGDITIVPDQSYTLGLSIDRAAGTMTASFDGIQRTINLTTPVFPAQDSFRRVQSWLCCDVTGTSVVGLKAVRTANFSDDLSSGDPGVFRYRPFYDASGTQRTVAVNDGTLRLQARATEDDDRSMRLITNEPTDYVELRFAISSESDLGSTGRARFFIENRLYNDTRDGGNGVDDIGMVDAVIEAEIGADGRARVEYCLTRRNGDADRDGLLDGGDGCKAFALRIEPDTFYRVSIALNRDDSSVTFRLNGLQQTQSINTPIFDSRDNVYVGAVARDLANAVVLIDDLRTAPEILTEQELITGLDTPPAFPEPVDLSTLAVDSTISSPYDFDRQVSFIDEFSDADASTIGYWGGSRQDRGESGIQFVDGALELQTNASSLDDSNYSEIYINGRTDQLRARISLSSDSTLPADPEAEATVGLRVVFHNDVQDFGTGNGREGDIILQIALRLEGDGRRRAYVLTNRRDESDEWQRYDIIDGDNYAEFDGLTASLDILYDLALSIDRERGVLIASIDERTMEIPLPTAAFKAAAAEANIQVSHRGSSGRAIGRIHSIETDNFKRDFTNGSGVIAPYAPRFNTRYPGREVTVADGLAKLLTDATLSSGRDTRIWAAGGSDYVGASVNLSSESTIATDGAVQLGVASVLYNDLAAGDGNEGRVFGEVWLKADADNTPYAQYCLFRSNDTDFNDVIDVIAGSDKGCLRFDLAVSLDTMYPLSLKLNRERSVVEFTVGTQTREYAIATSLFDITRPFNAVQLRASDGSIGVGYVDSLAFSDTPVVLAESDQQLVTTVDATTPITGEITDETGTPTTPDTGDTIATTPDETNGSDGVQGDEMAPDTSSKSSSSGCSIAGVSGSNSSLILLVIIALAGLARRRRRFL